MTIWSPRLPAHGSGPLYRRIAEEIERDMAAGVLVDGSRLPTQRELAERLGITVVTVTRSYAEAAARGLVESSVGRGTFVRASRRAPRAVEREIDLATNIIAGAALPSLGGMVDRLDSAAATTYGVGAGSQRHRAAGAAWMGRALKGASPSQLIVTAGSQHALFLACSLASPGERLLTDQLTYHGVKGIAALLRLSLQGLASDRYGMLPDALERACRKRGGKLLYLMPTIHNPLGTVMPDKRRRDLAAVALRHGLTVIEDDVYGFLVPDPPPALATHAPEQTLFLTGTGKSVGPALRVGYLHAAAAFPPRLEAALMATTLFASSIGAEIASTWIEDGTALRIAERKRASVAVRQQIARRILGGAVGGSAHSPHLWLELPRQWEGETFAEAARRAGVRLSHGGIFAVDPESPPRAVRISIAAAESSEQLDNALQIVASLLERRSGPAASSTTVV